MLNSLALKRTHIIIGATGLILDQITKFWAVARLGDENGRPTGEAIRVIGDLLRFQLAYNEGAAFSSRPQDILPWLHPTLFFGLLTAAAAAGLIYFYRDLPKTDWMSRLGTVSILFGALGNLADRIRIHKVVDFIDADFPNFLMYRWPTFNIADSMICVGVALVLVGPLWLRRQERKSASPHA